MSISRGSVLPTCPDSSPVFLNSLSAPFCSTNKLKFHQETISEAPHYSVSPKFTHSMCVYLYVYISVCMLCIWVCLCASVFIYPSPTQSGYESLWFLWFVFFSLSHFSSIDLKTPTKPKQVFILGRGDSFLSLLVGI